MAESPSHKFGQIIGNLLEDIIEPVLRDFTEKRNLFLDIKGVRPGVRKGKKVTWTDSFGNNHDLDFVIEATDSSTQQGRPVAFIEAAWRRYTKHSKNKAQEIQGAVLPIAEKHIWDRPFLGAVLAGEFTGSSLEQLRSVGFKVLYFPYPDIIAAFASIGIDVAFDEATPDDEFSACIARIEALSPTNYEVLKSSLQAQRKELFDDFLDELAQHLDRIIEKLIVVPLYGDERVFASVSEAMHFVNEHDEATGSDKFKKYEISAAYTNGDIVSATLRRKMEVERFLKYLSS